MDSGIRGQVGTAGASSPSLNHGAEPVRDFECYYTNYRLYFFHDASGDTPCNVFKIAHVAIELVELLECISNEKNASKTNYQKTTCLNFKPLPELQYQFYLPEFDVYNFLYTCEPSG